MHRLIKKPSVRGEKGRGRATFDSRLRLAGDLWRPLKLPVCPATIVAKPAATEFNTVGGAAASKWRVEVKI